MADPEPNADEPEVAESEPGGDTPPVFEEGEFVDLMDQEQQRIDLM